MELGAQGCMVTEACSGRRTTPAPREWRGFDAELVHRPAVVEVVAVRLSVTAGVGECAHEAEMRLFVVPIGLEDAKQMGDGTIGIDGVASQETECRDIRRAGCLTNGHRPIVVGILLEEVARVDGRGRAESRQPAGTVAAPQAVQPVCRRRQEVLHVDVDRVEVE